MTREEWAAVLDSAPITVNQRGRILGECDRLGLADRGERLAVLAALLGLEALGSTADLTMGQAGKLVNILQRTADRSGLPAAADAGRHQDDPRGDEPADSGGRDSDRMTLAETMTHFGAILYTAFGQTKTGQA